jgi:TetR/AcrR family hemagglutinin/protease transcriptional regulator
MGYDERGTDEGSGRSRRGGPRPRARRLAPEERRAALLGCALRVFARRGLAAARHAEVAREAAVSVSATFVYFPSRRALVQAVLDEVARFLLEMAEEIHRREERADRLVLAHARAFAQSVDTHPDHARVWLDWSTAIGSESWPRYLEFQERMLRVVARTLERGRREGSLAADVDPLEDARLLIGAAHMVAQMKLTRSSPESVDRFLRTLVRAIMGLPLGQA